MRPQSYGIWTKVFYFSTGNKRNPVWKKGVWFGWIFNPSNLYKVVYYQDNKEIVRLVDDGDFDVLYFPPKAKRKLIKLFVRSLFRKRL